MPLLKTQALVVHGAGEAFKLQDVYIDETSLDLEQALVDFEVAGICHTDVCTQDGTFPHVYPCVLGHEGAGRIRSLPAGYKGALSVGDTVLCSYDACGSHCASCKTGYPAACHSFFPRIFWGLKLDGSTTDCYGDEAGKGEKINLGFFGQSSFMRTGIVNLGSMIKIDQGLPLHLLCAFGCGIMTGFGTVLNKLLPTPEKTFTHLPDFDSLKLPTPTPIADTQPKTIVVFGMGAVGMGAIVGARVAKIANIIAVDMVDSRLELAKEAGATHTLNGKLSTEELVEAVKKISPDGTGANFALEGSGSGIALANAMACLAPLGKCAGVGAPKPGLTIEIDMNSMVSSNRTYMGVLLGDSITSVLLPYMVALFKRGDFAIMEKLVKTYKPEEMERAVADSKSGKVVKPVIVW